MEQIEWIVWGITGGYKDNIVCSTPNATVAAMLKKYDKRITFKQTLRDFYLYHLAKGTPNFHILSKICPTAQDKFGRDGFIAFSIYYPESNRLTGHVDEALDNMLEYIKQNFDGSKLAITREEIELQVRKYALPLHYFNEFMGQGDKVAYLTLNREQRLEHCVGKLSLSYYKRIFILRDTPVPAGWKTEMEVYDPYKRKPEGRTPPVTPGSPSKEGTNATTKRPSKWSAIALMVGTVALLVGLCYYAGLFETPLPPPITTKGPAISEEPCPCRKDSTYKAKTQGKDTFIYKDSCITYYRGRYYENCQPLSDTARCTALELKHHLFENEFKTKGLWATKNYYKVVDKGTYYELRDHEQDSTCKEIGNNIELSNTQNLVQAAFLKLYYINWNTVNKKGYRNVDNTRGQQGYIAPREADSGDGINN
jgi:hypothetical protein